MSPLYKNYFDKAEEYQGGSAIPEGNKNKIYKLSSNENMLGCSPMVQDSLTNSLSNLNIYPAPSDSALRAKIANHVGYGLTERNIITGNGGVNIIHLIIQAFLDHDLECIVPSPSFIPYFGMPAQMNARVKRVLLNQEDFSINVEAILAAITPNTRMICLASPNNPTGSIITQVQLDSLIESIPNHILVVYDEVYQQYVTDPEYGRPIKHILQNKPVIALNSFSKAYGLAALRIGYAYTSAEVAEYLRHFMRPFYINQLSQQAVMAALEDQAFITQVVTTTNKEKQFLCEAFDQLGLKHWKSEANFILVKPNTPAQLFEQSLFEKGIMVRSGDAFEAPGHIRITIGDREANHALIRALRNTLL